ncbi:MAG: NUDIX hydrolase [Anaerolineae bacterium]|nr:NUDIX hydrolase [Anaerolineae bacterium]
MTKTNQPITLSAKEAAQLREGFKYCPRCRTEMVDREAFGRVRRVCPACNFIQFIDPKVGASVLAERDGQVLLVKRKMDPARGSWCLPGGFMEMSETPQESAARECREETGLEVEITRLIDVYYYQDYRGSGVSIIYKGHVVGGALQPGDDVTAARFFGPDELPENIVFKSNLQALAGWRTGEI